MKKIVTLTLVIGLLLSGSLLAAQRMVQIKGSDTLVNLVQVLAEEFMAKNPRSPIAVLGGGSGTGIAALINGTTDIANHSRPMKDSEKKQCMDKGIDYRTFIIAIDGLSIIVNKNNPLNEIPMDTVGAIFRGEITNWKDVGGPDMKISLYGRQSNSGTYVFFQEYVLGNQDYSADMKRMNGNAQIVEGIIQDRASIGYVGVGYVVDTKTKQARSDLKILNVSKDASAQAFSPLNRAAVDSGDYPVSRPLFQTSAGKPDGAVAEFLKFIISPEGQKIVEAEGFFSIGEGIIQADLDKMK